MKQVWIEGHGKNPDARQWRNWTFGLARLLEAIVSSIGQDFNGEGRVWNIRVRGQHGWFVQGGPVGSTLLNFADSVS